MLAIFFFMAGWCNVDAKTKNVIIPSNGIYVFDLNGDFHTYDSWDIQNNNSVVGIALITDNTQALIALRNANTDGYVVWGPDGLVDGVVTTASNYSNCIPGVALSDYNGASNTQKEVQQLTPQSNTALYLANTYLFPDNHNGYLPALGELIDMFENFDDVNNLLEKVNGEKIENFWYWSSTQHYLSYRAWAYGGTDSDGNRWFAQLRNEDSPLSSTYGTCLLNVRPFGVIPQTMEIEDNGCNKPAEVVDLGLSVNWATCNLCAQTPEEIGGYFAWGETFPKTHFDKSNYQYYENGSYQNIGNDISGTIYDAATANWGEGWRMPTKEELSEFASKCSRSSYTLNGVKGLLFEGPNGNTLFIPNSGHDYEEGVGSSEAQGCGLWSSTSFGTSSAYRAWEWSYISYSYRYQGFPIRPVRDKNIDDNKCATPTISLLGRKLHFDCKTEGVTFHYSISAPEISDNTGNDVVVSSIYTINVYASKEGYEDSNIAAKEIDIRGLKGDADENGIVDIADAVHIVNIVVGKANTLAPKQDSEETTVQTMKQLRE
jgi:hypothetical protein